MKNVAVAALLASIALAPFLLDPKLQDIVSPLAYTYGIVLTSVALLLSLSIFRSSRGERKSFGFSIFLTMLVLTVAVLLATYELYGQKVPDRARLYVTFLSLSPLPLLAFGVWKLAKDFRFITLARMASILVPFSILLINHQALRSLCLVYPSVYFGIAICVAAIFVYSLLLSIYLQVESSVYWLSMVAYFVFFDLALLSFARSECTGAQYVYSSSLYNLAMVSAVVGMYSIHSEELVTISFGEIEEQRRKYAELFGRVSELKDVLGLINKMLRHDVLNKLQVIAGYIEAFEESGERRFLERAKEVIRECSEYVEKIRELETAVTSGETLKPVRVRDIVERIFESYSIDHRVRGDCVALADEGLVSVIDNIISNAIRHSGTDRIDVWLSEFEDECEIRISDYGVGIPEDVRQKVFEETFRYGEKGGSGLGLYIAKKIVERYGGRIWIEDTKPHGTTFVIRLKSPKSK